MPMTGYGPSALPSVGAGGKATETSSGIPSQLRICAAVVPQKRWPEACTVQLIGVVVFVNTWGIAASAVDGISDPAASTAATVSILLRIWTLSSCKTTQHRSRRRADQQLDGGSAAAQVGDHFARYPQAQREDAGEVAEHQVGERGLVSVQAVEAGEIEPHDLDVGQRVERGRARAAVEEGELPEHRGCVDRLERALVARQAYAHRPLGQQVERAVALARLDECKSRADLEHLGVGEHR